LEVNVGDKALFKKLTAAHNLSKVSNDVAVENALWETIDAGLGCFDSQSQDNLMVVVDGLSELGTNSKDTVTTRLQGLVSKHQNVKVIILARNISSKQPGGVKSLGISPDHTHNDLERVLRRSLRNSPHYQEQKENEQEAIIEKLVLDAKGSFLWAALTADQLSQTTNHKAFMDAVNASPRSLDEILRHIIGRLDFSKPDFRSLFAWTLAAERPFSIDELKCLLSVDLERKATVDRRITLLEDLAIAKSLLVVRNGFVSVRSPYIRSYLTNLQADQRKFISNEEGQTDLTLRLLAYLKYLPKSACELTFEIPGWNTVKDRFRSYRLTEYAVGYWMEHFRRSTMWKETGPLAYSAVLKAIFPASIELALMEWTYWELRYSQSHALKLLETALRIRTDNLGENHQAVLQNIIVCGNLYMSLSKPHDAAPYFYRASTIGQAILVKFSTITTNCTSRFLKCTESLTITTRTKIVTMREEMLRYIITSSKHTHGETSDITIKYCKSLARLYVEIHEEQNAEVIWRELHELTIKRFGKGSEEESSAARELVIVLKKEDKESEVVEYDWDFFQTVKTMEVWDIRRIEITLKLALSYESRQEFFLAEELYVKLWTQLIHHCRQSHHHEVDIYISVIDVALEYVRFLRRCHRHEEAASILICIWEEYEEYEFDSEVIFLRLKVVGELMKAVSLLSIAISVFKKCWGWFSSHSLTEHTESCEVLIQETMKEITVWTTTTTTTSTDTTTTETVIKKVFESVISKTTVTSETILTCQTLVSFYMRLENWSEAIVVSKKSLAIIWKMVLFGSGTCALPKNFDSEGIDLAIRLAVCYDRSQNFHEAENIYRRIYRACITSCSITDERLTRSHGVLIRFYEEHKCWEQMIHAYKDLIVEYRQHLGVKHSLYIKTLYILGSLCSEHGFGHGYEYYEEIVTICNGPKNVFHHDSKDAMIFLCRYYHEMGQWEKLQNICHVLWTTWTHHHQNHEFKAEFIELLYKRYTYVLQYHAHSQYDVLRKITIEFRDTCIKAFTAFSRLTIVAMIELANICMKSKKHIHEAVTIYEEVRILFSSNNISNIARSLQKPQLPRLPLQQLYQRRLSKP
jgi:tetratricopeptide (TPR) repeat protein